MCPKNRTENEETKHESGCGRSSHHNKKEQKTSHETRGQVSEPRDHVSLPRGYTLRVGRDGIEVRSTLRRLGMTTFVFVGVDMGQEGEALHTQLSHEGVNKLSISR